MRGPALLLLCAFVAALPARPDTTSDEGSELLIGWQGESYKPKQVRLSVRAQIVSRDPSLQGVLKQDQDAGSVLGLVPSEQEKKPW